MPVLPILSGRDVVATLSVPDHQELARGTLRSLIRGSGLTVDEFLALIRKQPCYFAERSERFGIVVLFVFCALIG